MTPEGSTVLIDIKAQVNDSVLSRIRVLGGTIISSFPQFDAIRATFPTDRLNELAAIPEVRFIKPAEQGGTSE